MSSSAAQLPVTAAAGIVAASRHGLPSAADAATQASLGRPAGGRRRRSRRACPDADPRGSSLGPRSLSVVRASVQLVGRTSGVQASGVQATGAIQVSGRTGVRCPRPVHPRCPHRAASGTRRCGGTGQVWRTGLDVLLSTAGLGRRLARPQAAAPRSPPGRPGSWSSARVPVGRLGEQGRNRCSQVSPQVRPGQVAGVMPDHGLNPKVVTTLSGRGAGLGPLSSGSGGPIRPSGEQAAAAARPR
jgi:hypothetical protein